MRPFVSISFLAAPFVRVNFLRRGRSCQFPAAWLFVSISCVGGLRLFVSSAARSLVEISISCLVAPFLRVNFLRRISFVHVKWVRGFLRTGAFVHFLN